MIRLYYTCSEQQCGFSTGLLTAAQDHADTTQHTLRVEGSLSADLTPTQKTVLSQKDKDKLKDLAILREAKRRGLL